MYQAKLDRQYHQEYINKQPDFKILENIRIACKPEIEKYGKVHVTNNHEEIADYLSTYKDIKGVLSRAQESGGLIRHAVSLNAHPEVLRLFIHTYIRRENGVSLRRALFEHPQHLKDTIHLAFEGEKTKGSMLRPESFDLLLEAYSECDQELFYSNVIFAMKEGGDSPLKKLYGGNWLMFCVQHPLNISSTILLSASCAANFLEFQRYFKAMSILFLGLAQPRVVETSGMIPDVSNAELMAPISSKDFFLRANNPWKKSMLLYKDRFGKYPTNERKVSFQSIELAKTEASKSCCSVQ